MNKKVFKISILSISENDKIKNNSLETILSNLKIKNGQPKCGVKNVSVGPMRNSAAMSTKDTVNKNYC